MKVAIVGSRKYPDKAGVVEFVNSLPKDTIIVSGGAKGVDSWAEHAARMRGMERQIYKPLQSEIIKYGFPVAAFNRNQTIVDNADEVVAFWNGLSRGTLDTIKKAYIAGVPVTVNLEAAEGVKLADATRKLDALRRKYKSVN